MKQMFWIFLVLGFSFSLFVVLLFGGLLLFTKVDGVAPTQNEIFATIGLLVVIVPVLVFGIIKGIKKIKSHNPKPIIPYHKQLNISASGAITFKSYRNMVVSYYLRKGFLVYFTILFLIIFFHTFTHINRTGGAKVEAVTSILTYLGIFGLFIFMIFSYIKKQYKRNKLLHEHFVYHLTNEQIELRGQTMQSTLQWSHFDKMKEISNFYLFFNTRTGSVILDKQLFSAEDREELIQFVQSLKIKHLSLFSMPQTYLP